MRYLHIKRLIDIVISVGALIVLLPMFLIIGILLLLSGEKHVFYIQDRIGKGQKKFKMIKFSTMLKNSPQMPGGMITTPNDPRVTPIGKVLRKYKINELPQLINVLIGEMSVVGPRPLVDETFKHIPKQYREKYYNLKPGLTGIGSIVFRDEEKVLSNGQGSPDVIYETIVGPLKGELEQWYQRNLSFKTDFLIILLTIWYIFFPESKIVYKLFSDLPDMTKVTSPQYEKADRH